MKLKFKIEILAVLLLCTIFTIGCPRKQPVTEIGFSCQRLSSCYVNYGNQLNDIAVRTQVDEALKTKDENKCSSAIIQFSSAVKQECPF